VEGNLWGVVGEDLQLFLLSKGFYFIRGMHELRELKLGSGKTSLDGGGVGTKGGRRSKRC